MRDGAWNGDESVPADVGERSDLAGSFVEWLHWNGNAENVGKLELNATTVGSDDCVYFVESALSEECCSEIVLSGDLKVISRE